MRQEILNAVIVPLFAATCALGPNASLATERGHASTLNFVYPLGTGDFILAFDNDSAQCTALGPPKYMYVSVGQNGVTAEGAKKMFATAMLAFALRKQLSVAFGDSTSACFINRLTVYN